MNLLLLSINSGAVPDFLAQCTGKQPQHIRIGYITDAAEGMPFAAIEHEGVEAFGYNVIDICARRSTVEDFATLLDTLDAIYVAGGETFVLLEALRSNGTGDVLADRVRAGLPYIGCSAGSIIAGPTITPAELMDDRESAPDLRSDEGLNLIDNVVIPHADGNLPPYPPELIKRIVSTYGDRYPLLTLRDDQALWVTSDTSKVVTSA